MNKKKLYIKRKIIGYYERKLIEKRRNLSYLQEKIVLLDKENKVDLY